MTPCVFGILKTTDGLDIREEMMPWLSEHYSVIPVEQDPPGELFEYPAILAAAKTAVELGEPVLYIHTKGAAHPSEMQELVRYMWRLEFTENMEKYLTAVSRTEPAVACPYTGINRVTWFNGFFMNPGAANKLLSTITIRDRYWYEMMFRDKVMSDVKLTGILNSRVGSMMLAQMLVKEYWRRNPPKEYWRRNHPKSVTIEVAEKFRFS